MAFAILYDITFLFRGLARYTHVWGHFKVDLPIFVCFIYGASGALWYKAVQFLS
jgi:hypothetical protein